jgi:hypothetical protein
MAKRKTKKVPKAPPSEGSEHAKSFGRGGFMAHKLTKRRKTRASREREALREHTDTGD